MCVCQITPNHNMSHVNANFIKPTIARRQPQQEPDVISSQLRNQTRSPQKLVASKRPYDFRLDQDMRYLDKYYDFDCLIELIEDPYFRDSDLMPAARRLINNHINKYMVTLENITKSLQADQVCVCASASHGSSASVCNCMDVIPAPAPKKMKYQ